jgi:hypothetical protein
VRLIVDEGTPSFKLEFSPYHQSREQPGTMKMSADDEAEFRRQMDRRAAALADPDELARRWRAFCMTQKPMYFSYLRGHGRLLRRLNRRVHFTERLLSRDTLLVLLDLFRCDTHQEAIEAILMDAAFESGEQKTHCSRPPYPGAQL